MSTCPYISTNPSVLHGTVGGVYCTRYGKQVTAGDCRGCSADGTTTLTFTGDRYMSGPVNRKERRLAAKGKFSPYKSVTNTKGGK